MTQPPPEPPTGPTGPDDQPSPPPAAPPPAAPPPAAPPPGGGYESPAPPAPPPGGGYGGGPAPGYGTAPGPGYGAPGPGQGGQLGQQDERTWGMLAHISAILAAIVGLSFLGPLIVLLVQGPKSQFVRRHAIESLNFQITTYIAAIISFILIFVLIGILLIVVVGIGWLVLTILAGVAANRGEDYRYPVNLRLIK